MIHRAFTFLTRPLTLLCILFTIQFGLFLYTTVYPYTNVHPPGRTYLFLRGHLIYSSLIRQSKEGAWKVFITHTTRPTPAVYGHLFFVFLGKIAAIFNIDPPVMYMISRVAAAIVLFIAVYWLVKLILPKSLHAMAILFILALEPGPLITTLNQPSALWLPSIFSYYPQVVAYRHFGLPHHTMGEAVGLFFLGTFILCLRAPSMKRYLSLFILGIIGTTILPPYFAILGMTVFAPWAVYSLFDKSWKKIILPLILSAASVGLVALFMSHEFAKGYPWKNFNFDEKRWVTNSDVLLNYVSTLILYIPFVAFLWVALIKLWKGWDAERRRIVFIMTTWVVFPVFLVLLSSQPWFPLANFRLMDGYDYAPMGVLATLGFYYFIKSLKKPAVTNFLQGFLIMGLVVASGFLTTTYTKQTLDDLSTYIWSNAYLRNDHWKAFTFLNTVPKWSGIMVTNHFGEIIPEFASVRTFIGSTPGFVDWTERFNIAARFYSGEMTDAEAAETLKREDISYVYYSEEERYYNKTGTLYPNLLTAVFTSPYVMIYKVNARVK